MYLLAVDFVFQSMIFVVAECGVHIEPVDRNLPVRLAYALYALLVVDSVQLPHFEHFVSAPLEKCRAVAFNAFARIESSDYTRLVRYVSRRLLRELGKLYDCSVSKVGRNDTKDFLVIHFLGLDFRKNELHFLFCYVRIVG